MTADSGLHVAHLHTGKGWGGGEHQVLGLVSSLAHRGIATTLYAHPGGALFRRASELGTPVDALPPVAPLLRGLWSRMLSRGTTVVHAHDSSAAGIGGTLGVRHGVPVVLSRRIASPLRQNALSTRKYSSARIDAVIAISRTVRDVFAASGYPVDRIHVVSDGLDLAALSAIKRDEALREQYGPVTIIGGIGKLSLKKNWAFMLRVAARLAEQGQNIQWLLVGDGPERDNLKNLAEDLSISAQIDFLGYRKDASRILKSLDLLFFPSLMEGSSVTVREAMAQGVPVLAVDAPGTMESLAGHGWSVSDGDVDGAAMTVTTLLADKRATRDKCDGARALANEQFSLEKTVDGTLAVYRQVIAQKMACHT